MYFVYHISYIKLNYSFQFKMKNLVKISCTLSQNGINFGRLNHAHTRARTLALGVHHKALCQAPLLVTQSNSNHAQGRQLDNFTFSLFLSTYFYTFYPHTKIMESKRAIINKNILPIVKNILKDIKKETYPFKFEQGKVSWLQHNFYI